MFIRMKHTTAAIVFVALAGAAGLHAQSVDPFPAFEVASVKPSDPNSVGMSITGGYVYRGKKIPSLRGVYVYGDYAMGTIWGFRYENAQVAAHGTLINGNPSRNPASFAEDREGELYVLCFDGNIYSLTEKK